ncbi:uncharacterized protein PGTG_07013 [Puccinia graminis f. sp. tritici CRL 75-36-700-3]|uniref:Uncharacterized protein n=1 Tax=Puccinia graminis f. sp. tritici (strain CRL 75-36-700-3 / race SCCL) TaxID=418459 RepID=E3KAG2_PUCGT|nr:uncharacterized protein PGTG_07013 [Puccinia graminis f. sp. tritici CRL 75-36-700-3]EFP81392.2 hypothetical protein PGTG_07013 [Puccinia graminis f. sp. tritici CRL 75-36-700-3]
MSLQTESDCGVAEGEKSSRLGKSSWCRVGSVYSGHGRDGPGYVPTNAWQHLSGADSIVWPKTQGVKFTAGRRKPNPNPNLIDGYTREREVGRWID